MQVLVSRLPSRTTEAMAEGDPGTGRLEVDPGLTASRLPVSRTGTETAAGAGPPPGNGGFAVAPKQARSSSSWMTPIGATLDFRALLPRGRVHSPRALLPANALDAD
ncbi:hypothetical protein mvi_28670 [Methylobacterium indicum]|uniref:Uncharacterized protein n=1 Tax=Methylobacterium indicum TaxID=1775910 RepID=A0A8H9C768_9HYPH|nr:hypothetical protein mvi_28670 [Methylobacterium indicum]